MGRSLADGAHFVNRHVDAPLGELQRGLAAGEATAYHMDLLIVIRHVRTITAAGIARGLGYNLALAGALTLGCSRSPASDPAPLTADQAWVRAACREPGPFAAEWPRYTIGRISIAVPPEFRRGASDGFSLEFSRGTASLRIALQRMPPRFFFGYNRPAQEICEGEYGGIPSHVYSWHGQGRYEADVVWLRLNEPDIRPMVRATVRATRLADAQVLRQALHTIAVIRDSRP